jgi:UDP-2-acetamido-3-amino-2,3-dideoxy-glucuronate N-acetyltransferase
MVAMPISHSAEVDKECRISTSTFVWGNAMVCKGVDIGDGVTIGRSAYIGPGVKIGHNSRIQNQAQIYEPAEIGEGVLVGPNVVLTNDKHPRALNPLGQPKTTQEWKSQGVILKDGCSVGAQTVCVGPVTVGEWAMVAAGSVVIHNVKDYELVGGTPARHLGWVGHAGYRLVLVNDQDSIFRCQVTDRTYSLLGGKLTEII